MECTQRLDFESSQTERICPEQIGFLGILGTKYPVKRGPNKVGRDPQTCNIVINLNSISRQHAVINVLNGKEFMLMDLDSANKTRLNNKVLQAYIPVPLTNCDTVQFGEVFGIFRLLEEETDLPCTQAIDIPDTPVASKHAAKFRHAMIPESPDVSDKDDSFIVPSQPKLQSKFKSPCNNFINASGKTIAKQPLGSKKNDSVSWCSSKKSDSFSLDDSNRSLNDPSLNEDHEKIKPNVNDSSDSIYTAETQLPSGNNSIYSQATQLPVTDQIANKENDNNIHNAETQLPDDNNIYDAKTQLPFEKSKESSDIFEAETQLPFGFNIGSTNKNSKSIHEMETQEALPSNNESTNSIYTAETQLPTVDSSPSIYSQPTQLPKYGEFEIQDSPKSIYDANTELSFEEPNALNNKNDVIFDAETQLPSGEKQYDICNINDNIVNYESDLPAGKTGNVSDEAVTKDKSFDKNKSDELILFQDIENENCLDDFDSQPLLVPGNIPFLEESEEIPLSQSDTITDDDFEVRLNDKATDFKIGVNDDHAKSDKLRNNEDFDLLPTQKITANHVNEDDVTDCEEDETNDKKPEKPEPSHSSKIKFEELATQIIPEAGPSLEPRDNFEDLATQVIPQLVVVGDVDKESVAPATKPSNEPVFEEMLTQVIPEKNDDDTNFEDIATQIIPEESPSKPLNKPLQFSEEIIASPFKIPFQTPLKSKKKDTPKSGDPKIAKTNSILGKRTTDNSDENYYAATQEIIEDLCSQKDSSDTKTINLLNNIDTEIRNKQDVAPCVVVVDDYKVGSKIHNCLEGEMEITVNKSCKAKSSESSDGEEKVNKFVSSLSKQQISDIIIGVDVAMPKRVPSDPSDVEVTPKKVRPFKFVETLLPDSQEIKTNVTLSSKTMATDSSSESEQEKEPQEQTPIVFRKKKRAKADVKKDLITKFDAQTLPTRIITRIRKPTVKILECDTVSKKNSRNILKPKYLNDSQDEIDSEIITENISRLKTKIDKKNHKDTLTDAVKDEEVQRKDNKCKSDKGKLDASNHKSTEEVDRKLTHLNEEETDKSKNEKLKGSTKLDESKLRGKQKSKDTDSDISKQKHEPRRGRLRKKDIQDKITNYTISTTGDSKNSSSVSKFDESLETADVKNKSTKSTRQSKNKESSIKEKSTSAETEISKRKRGRPRKDDKAEEKKEDKRNTRQKDKDDGKDAKSKKKEEKQEIVEQEVRRSLRQKTKESNDSQSTGRQHEKSTVYNASSESVGSPKRKIDAIDVDVPSPKRTRSMSGNAAISLTSSNSNSTASSMKSATVNSNNSSLRSTPACGFATHRVLFTAFPSEEVKAKLQKLGAVVVSEVWECTVVLTLQLRRTFKLLCAVGLGRPIVGPPWVQACVDTNTIVDPWQYLLKDDASEARFKFSLARTLSSSRNYLKGYYVSATPKVLPSAPEMKLIVECSGGVWQAMGPKGRWLVVSCPADRHLHEQLRAKGGIVVTTELILSGVLRQQLDIQGHLFK